MIDFQMALNLAGAIIRICFSGGQMSTNGVISAKYVTDNPAIQRMIEDSDHFKKGRIYEVKTRGTEKSSQNH